MNSTLLTLPNVDGRIGYTTEVAYTYFTPNSIRCEITINSQHTIHEINLDEDGDGFSTVNGVCVHWRDTGLGWCEARIDSESSLEFWAIHRGKHEYCLV